MTMGGDGPSRRHWRTVGGWESSYKSHVANVTYKAESVTSCSSRFQREILWSQ